jgi:hypothetical protein
MDLHELNTHHQKEQKELEKLRKQVKIRDLSHSH